MANVMTPEMPVLAVIKEAPTVGAAIKPVVDAARKTMTEQGAEAAAKSLASQQPDSAVSKHIINENIGLDRDPATGLKIIGPGSDQETRANRAKAEDLKLADYFSKGYDKLTPAQKTDLSNQILNRLKQTPTWNAAIGSMNATQKAEFVQRIATNPDFRSKVLEGYTSAFGTELVDGVTAVGAEVSALQGRLDKLMGVSGPPVVKGELTKLDERIQTIKDEINEYQVEVKDPLVPGGIRPGKNYARMATTITEVGAVANEVKLAQLDADDKQFEIDKLSREKPTPGRDQATINAERRTAMGELSTRNATLINKQTELQQKTDLYQKIKTGEEALKIELAEKDAKFTELDESRLDIESKLSVKRMELSKGNAKRTHEEEMFVRKLEEIIGNAADSWMEDQIESAVTLCKTELEKKSTESDGAKTDAFAKSLSERYFNGKKVNTAQVKEDYKTLLSSGPDALTVATLARSGFSPTEIADIQRDPAKFAVYRNQVTENILKMYMLRGGWLKSGGKMSPDEVIKISTSTWGKDMIENAFKGRSELVATINKAGGDQILSSDGKLTERFKKHPIRNMMMIMLALVALLGGGIFGAGKI